MGLAKALDTNQVTPLGVASNLAARRLYIAGFGHTEWQAAGHRIRLDSSNSSRYCRDSLVVVTGV
jgi:hypothetical protein